MCIRDSFRVVSVIIRLTKPGQIPCGMHIHKLHVATIPILLFHLECMRPDFCPVQYNHCCISSRHLHGFEPSTFAIGLFSAIVKISPFTEASFICSQEISLVSRNTPRYFTELLEYIISLSTGRSSITSNSRSNTNNNDNDNDNDNNKPILKFYNDVCRDLYTSSLWLSCFY